MTFDKTNTISKNGDDDDVSAENLKENTIYEEQERNEDEKRKESQEVQEKEPQQELPKK